MDIKEPFLQGVVLIVKLYVMIFEVFAPYLWPLIVAPVLITCAYFTVYQLYAFDRREQKKWNSMIWAGSIVAAFITGYMHLTA